MINKLKYIKRYREILKIFLIYFFENIFYYYKLDNFLNKFFAFFGKNYNFKKMPNEVRLRIMLEKLGPTFIKLGQVISSRPDIVSFNYLEELKKLQDNVNEEDYFVIKKSIENILNENLDNIFLEIFVKPIGTASIAQVHEAILLTGERVVIKIKKSNVEEIIKLDLKILINLSQLLEKSVPSLKIYKPSEVVKEFFEILTKELDFDLEARNNEIMSNNFKDFEGLVVPKIYWSYTKRDVIVMEKIQGEKLSKIISNKDSRKKDLASLIAKIFLKQVLEKGFFHGDPHPGNIIILGNKVAFVDYGAVGKIDETTQDQILDIIYSLALGNTDRLISFLRRNSVITYESNVRKLREDLESLIDKYWNIPINKVDSSALLSKLYNLIYSHKLNIRVEFFIIAKTLVIIDGIIRSLDPDINVLSESSELITALIKKRYSFSKISRSFLDVLESYRELIVSFPSMSANISSYYQDKISRDREIFNKFIQLFLTSLTLFFAIQLLKYKIMRYNYNYSIPGVITLIIGLIMLIKNFENRN